MVGAAGLLAGEVGDVVLADERLIVDGDECPRREGAEVGVGGELAGLPGFFVALRVGVAVMVNFHGVFLGFNG